MSAAEEPAGAGELWLVRHGQTEWSATGRHTSVTEVPLTAEGEQQARRVRDRLAGEHFDLVLTSPRQRARRTAALAGFPDAAVDDDVHRAAQGSPHAEGDAVVVHHGAENTCAGRVHTVQLPVVRRGRARKGVR